MSARDFTKGYVYDLQRTFYQPMPERPIDPEPVKEFCFESAVKDILSSLQEKKISVYWDDYITVLFDELSEQEKDEIGIALQDGKFAQIGQIFLKAKLRALSTLVEIYGQKPGSEL